MIKTRIKAFSMIETLFIVSLTSIGILTAYKVINDNFEDQSAKTLATDINKILKGFDLRFNNDGFEKSKWSNYAGDNYSFENKEQVRDFLQRSLIGFNATSCGKLDGWKPVKKDTTESYKDKYNFISCNLWEKKLPLKLNAKIKLNIQNDYVNSLNLILFFDNDTDFKKNFKSLKKALIEAKASEEKGLTGIFNYQLISLETNNKIKIRECIKKKSKCGLEATYTGTDLSYDYLYTNGSNNMINSKIKFQNNYSGTAINTCFRYIKDGLSWRKISNVYCGIGYGKKDPMDINSEKYDYIELNTEAIHTNKIFLNKECTFRNADGSVTTAPCGIYLDGTSNTIISNYDQVNATEAFINIIDATTLKTKEATVNSKLEVNGDTELNGTLKVKETANLEDLKINGAASDVNLDVLSSAKLNNVEIRGSLETENKVHIHNSLIVDNDLDVKGKITTARIHLTESIGYSTLGKSCSSLGNGTMLNYQDSSYYDIAICANGKWKLLNVNKNQIMPFNGNCPRGFERFNEASGRTLMGSGNIYDSATNKTINYKVGQNGGEAFHKLTINEMPSHNHKYQDAYYVEKFGPNGEGHMQGSNATDYDNNLYIRNVYTDYTGGDAPHENRMPYYVVNWCIYKG